nr:DUF4177 domain-containing protein [Pasteurella atlantica]
MYGEQKIDDEADQSEHNVIETNLDEIINTEAKDGWILDMIQPFHALKLEENVIQNNVQYYAAIFKREI